MGHDPREASAPLVDAWHRARTRRMRPMQVPGHKSRYADGRDDLGSDDLPSDVFGSDLLGDLVRDDLPMQGGADDNAYTGGYLEQAEALWASAVGGDHARFLVGGSTQGNITSLIAAGGPERRVAVDRTSHRSALAGLVISGSNPVWVFPEIHPEFGLPLGVRPESLSELSGDVVALFVTSPTYVGTISDVRGLARQCQADDRTLIVDQAWGAHLGFMPGCGAIEQGADIVTT
ncbi:MAG: decarboxylase, partial [Actinobacteria bacterium]|nr:decarboxylase [Actinomycetota bacterium]